MRHHIEDFTLQTAAVIPNPGRPNHALLIGQKQLSSSSTEGRLLHLFSLIAFQL
jgi:hypothetical protein